MNLVNLRIHFPTLYRIFEFLDLTMRFHDINLGWGTSSSGNSSSINAVLSSPVIFVMQLVALKLRSKMNKSSGSDSFQTWNGTDDFAKN